jgi:AhpD family alkylhydroperoxidase
MMSNRSSTKEVDPRAYAAIRCLEAYISESGLDKVHYKLIKIRASQINGCAYCINMHTRDARKLGVSEQKLYLLSAWQETQLYTEEERGDFSINGGGYINRESRSQRCRVRQGGGAAG